MESDEKGTAYPKAYLDDAMDQVAEMFDLAVYKCRLDLGDFVDRYFLPIAAPKIQEADPFFVSGKSPIENIEEMVGHAIDYQFTPFEKSPEYWAGWTLAYVQWKLNLPFKTLLKAIPVKEFVELYWPLHEEDLSFAVNAFQKRIEAKEKWNGESCRQN